jgi:hypothetical protein
VSVRVAAGAAPRRLLVVAAASTSNYVVPLDAAPSGITRPLVEILRDLNKRVPDTIVLPASRRASASDPVVPWYPLLLCTDRCAVLFASRSSKWAKRRGREISANSGRSTTH